MAIGPTSGYETDPDKIDWIAAYQEPAYLNHLAGALVAFGAERFKKARIIEQLPQLETIQQHVKMKIITTEAAGKALLPFLMDWLIDEIRICIFFENLMKAELLSQGAIIHTFRDVRPIPKPRWCWQRNKQTKAQQLHKAQQNQPLAVSSLVINNITQELQRNTISMELMFKPKYQQVIRTPQDILEIVKRMNHNRNKLHLTSEVGGVLGAETIRELKLLDAYVDQQIARLTHP